MKTVILEQPGRFTFTDTPQPSAPGPGEVLVRVLTVGICGTDLHAFEGTQPFFSYPRILGHELAVEVIETGDGVLPFQPGDRCAVNPSIPRFLDSTRNAYLWRVHSLLARAEELLREDARDRRPCRRRHARSHSSAGETDVQVRDTAGPANSVGGDARCRQPRRRARDRRSRRCWCSIVPATRVRWGQRSTCSNMVTRSFSWA